jgi:acid phosphatase type 7
MRTRVFAFALAAVVASACSKSPTAPTAVPATVSVSAGTTSAATEVLVGAGDIANCGTTGAAATADLIGSQPGTVFTAGDNAYPSGSAQDFRDCYGPTWGRFLSRTRPAPGNHEYETAGAAGYFDFFGSRAGSGNAGYYAYSLGAWRIIVLNSEVPVSANSGQADWLKSELAAHPGGCSAAIWHRPLVSSGPHGDNADMRDLFQILYDAGVEFVVSGHDHLYERFSPVDPGGRPDSVRGVRQFIVGTGGTTLTGPVRMRLGSEVQATNWGIIRFDLSSGSYRWQFISVSGESFADSGVEMCH